MNVKEQIIHLIQTSERPSLGEIGAQVRAPWRLVRHLWNLHHSHASRRRRDADIDRLYEQELAAPDVRRDIDRHLARARRDSPTVRRAPSRHNRRVTIVPDDHEEVYRGA